MRNDKLLESQSEEEQSTTPGEATSDETRTGDVFRLLRQTKKLQIPGSRQKIAVQATVGLQREKKNRHHTKGYLKGMFRQYKTMCRFFVELPLARANEIVGSHANGENVIEKRARDTHVHRQKK